MRGLSLAYSRDGRDAKARETLLQALELVRQPRMTLLEARVRQSATDLGIDA
jgi:hypothetical protein